MTNEARGVMAQQQVSGRQERLNRIVVAITFVTLVVIYGVWYSYSVAATATDNVTRADQIL